jgi:propanediol dehydratase small subunit
MDRLYDDHQINDSSPTSDGQVTATATGQQMQATNEGQQSESQPGGLDTSSSVSGDNPVAAAVEASNWTHDDLVVTLSALSIVAWVATTWYVSKNT